MYFSIYKVFSHGLCLSLVYLCTRRKLRKEFRDATVLLKVLNSILCHISRMFWRNLEKLVDVLVGLYHM